MGRLRAALACGIALLAPPCAAAAAEFRVCADPNNLPFSDRSGAGFENKLAELIARESGEAVTYTWWAQRRGFVRNTLNAKLCDVVMGVPAGYDLLAVTRPYYRSSYVFVSRADRHYGLSSLKDARLRDLSIGVQLVGDDGQNTPPVHALSAQGIVANVIGFTVYGDYRQPSPAARIVDAVATGEVDVALAWGPLAGYFAGRAPVALAVQPVADAAAFAPERFAFAIGVGVRKDDTERRQRIDGILRDRQPAIDELLRAYGVPLLEGDAQ